MFASFKCLSLPAIGAMVLSFALLPAAARADHDSFEEGASQFVARLDVKPGMSVLDVACGSGNLAIPAARRGAGVTGLDIVPDLIDQARAAARAENLDARFDVGDAESMPYEDAGFDIVMSMFGAMFTPRPDVVSSELKRVCKPGGVIAMGSTLATAAWGDALAILLMRQRGYTWEQMLETHPGGAVGKRQDAVPSALGRIGDDG